MGNVPTSDPDQIIAFHKRLIEKLLESEEVVNAFSGETCSLGILLRNPEINLSLSLEGAKTKLEAITSEAGSATDPKISMSWDTAYRFWLGNIDIMSAVLTGAIRVEGQNMDPLFQLKSIVHKAREASQEIAGEFGWLG